MGQTPAKLAEIGNDQFKLFSYETKDSAKIENVQLTTCTFESVGLLKARFSNGAICHSLFNNCYLRHAEFVRTDLTGTHFTNCNLRHVSFEGCKLWYVEFKDCEIDYDNAIEAAPPANMPYLRKHFLRSLRLNAESMGDPRAANKLLLLEMKADMNEQLKIFMVSSVHYRDKFVLTDRLRAFVRWLLHWVESLVWGYGVRLHRLMFSAILLVMICGSILCVSELTFFPPENLSNGETRTLNFGECLYVSAVTFSTLGFGDFTPATFAARWMMTFLSFSGAVFLGLFTACAYRRIQR